MRRLILMPALVAVGLWSAPALAQSRSQLGPLCTTETTPADQQIDACNKIIALKVFSGEKLATIYFWRAVGWNKKGNYSQVISDAGEALRLRPNVALYNLRGSAYYDKGEYDIAIADFNDALRIGPLRKRPDRLGGVGIGKIRTPDRVERAGGNRQRAIDRIGTAMRADDVAVLRARHSADHRSAFARAGCAPGNREFKLGTRCRVRRNANMINAIGTSHRHEP